jgi:protein dithiol oxidoreductase (disulfide-forming)
MNARRRLLAAGGVSAALGGVTPVLLAQTGPALRAGTDYRVLDPAQPAPAERIEVLEFFYYGCPFCHQLEPLLTDWLKRLAPDVAFDRVPVIGRDSWAPLARLYFTLGALGVLGAHHTAVYRAFHDEGVHLAQPEIAADWASRRGIDRVRFVDAWRSAEVDARVLRARRMTDDYDIQATPSMVIDGRLLTSSGLTNGVPTLLPMVDRLIALARAERARAKPA